MYIYMNMCEESKKIKMIIIKFKIVVTLGDMVYKVRGIEP